jgi:hypothetical protein
MLGHVHHPQPIWLNHIEGPVHEILGWLGVGIPARAPSMAAPVDALHAGLAHQPFHPLAAAPNPFAQAELGVHPR